MHKILIIDDDDQIRKMYELFLSSEGYEVLSAASGEEGLRTFWKNNVDLVITCLLYTSPSPRDRTRSRMPSSA